MIRPIIRPIIRNAVLARVSLDSAGSMLAGSSLNVVANMIVAALFLIPMQSGARRAAALS
jgi:hypothetical protein